MQYTLRNIPDYVDAALRRAADKQRKSLNEVAVQALAHGAGFAEDPSPRRNLADVAGSWHEDPSFDAARAAQDVVDEELWPSFKKSRKLVRKGRAA